MTAVRAALKLAWERGTLTYLNQSGCWNAEHRTFALATAVHPELDTTPAHHVAAITDHATPHLATRKGVAPLEWPPLGRVQVLSREL